MPVKIHYLLHYLQWLLEGFKKDASMERKLYVLTLPTELDVKSFSPKLIFLIVKSR